MSAQNFLQFGLDISAFSADKKAALNEFIALFDKLEKYDGKVFSPLSGGGLQSFNNSAKETSLLLDEINSKINTINNIKINTGNTGYFKNVSNDAKEATNNVNTFNKSTDESKKSFALFGRELTRGLGVLREIAYILPGIGLAGIFNLAGEAVLKLAGYITSAGENQKSLTLLSNEYEENLKLTYRDLLDINAILQENNKLYQDLGQSLGIQFAKDDLSYYKAIGENLGIILDQKIKIGVLDKEQAERQLNISTHQSDTTEAVKTQGILIANTGATLEKLNEQKDKLLKSGKFFTGDDHGDSSNNIDILQKYIDAVQKYYDQQLKILTNYNKSKAALESDNAAKEKFDSDQARKLFVDTNKARLDSVIDTNRKIVADNKSTESEVLKALKNIENAHSGINDLTRINVTGVTDADAKKYGVPKNINLTATPDDILIANDKQRNDDLKNRNDYNKAVDETETEFYQRLIKAQRDSAKDAIQIEETKNQKIYEDQNKSLSERLEAYKNHILELQKIQDLELGVELQRGAKAPGAKTSLTSEEVKKLNDDTNKEKINEQADVERQIYDIVHTSLQKQLKDVLDTNKLNDESDKKEYADKLNRQTDLYQNGLIKYSEYRKNIKAIEKRYNTDGFQVAIDNDKKDIENLTNFISSLQRKASNTQNDVEESKSSLDSTKSNPNSTNDELLHAQRNYDAAVGANQAANDEIIESDTKRTEKIKKLQDDELAYAKSRLELINQAHKESANNIKKIVDGLFNLIKTAVDASYERQEEAIERRTKVVDESYDSEIAAIDKSNLSSKDKAALDIQLTEQKRENDKAAQAQENKIKHDKAVADRELAIANIIVDTELAYMEALATIPPPFGETIALERAALGAIAIATVLSTNIPSYSEGGIHPNDGLARYGEDGVEMIKEPNKRPYLALTETISYLPKGTEIVSNKDLRFDMKEKDESWDIARYLAKQFKKPVPQTKILTHIVININDNFKKRILGN